MLPSIGLFGTLGLLALAALLAQRALTGAAVPAGARGSEAALPSPPAAPGGVEVDLGAAASSAGAPGTTPLPERRPEPPLEVLPEDPAPATRAPHRPARDVRGRVVDSNGAPIEAALVLAASAGARLAWTVPARLDPPPARAPAWPFSPEPEHHRATDGLPPWPLDSPALPVQVMRAVTDADGGFYLPEVPVGWLALSVRKPGYASIDRAEHQVVPSRDLDAGELALELGARLAGRVVDAEGDPVPGARWWRPGDAAPAYLRPECGELLAMTDAEGRFEIDRLPAGPLRLALAVEDFTVQHLELAASPGEALPDRDVVLGGQRWIRGSVALGGGARPQELKAGALPVRCLEAVLAGTPPELIDGYREAPVASADLGRRGSFEVRGLLLGEPYLVRAMPLAGRFEAADEWSRAARAGRADLAVELEYAASAGFELALDSGRAAGELVARTGVGPEVHGAASAGRLRLDGLRPARPGDELRAFLSLEAAGCEPLLLESLVIRAGVTEDLGALQLAPGPAVLVRAVDERTGRPVAGAEVRLERDAGGAPLRRATTGAGGIARLVPHPSARALRVVHPRYAPAVVAAPAPVSPAHAELALPLEVELGPGGVVDVYVTDPHGAPVEAFPVQRRPRTLYGLPGLADDGSAIEAWSDAEGLARFPLLAPGWHMFFAPPPAPFLDPSVEAVAGTAGPVSRSLSVGALSAISGVVREQARALAGARVLLLDPQTFERHKDDVAARAFERLPQWLPSARTDSAGRYRLRPIWESGDQHALVVDHPSLALPDVVAVRPRAGEHELDVRARPVTVQVLVRSLDGEVPRGLELRLRYRPVPRREPDGRELTLCVGELADALPPEEAWFDPSELFARLPASVHLAWAAEAPDALAHCGSSGDARLRDVPEGVQVQVVVGLGAAVLGVSPAFEVDREQDDLVVVELATARLSSLRLGERSRLRASPELPGFLLVHAGRLADPPAMVWLPAADRLDGAGDLSPGRWQVFSGRPDALGRIAEWSALHSLEVEPGGLEEF